MAGTCRSRDDMKMLRWFCDVCYLGMDQYLVIPFLGGWTSINPSYIDVNYRGTRFWPIPILTCRPIVTEKRWRKDQNSNVDISLVPRAETYKLIKLRAKHLSLPNWNPIYINFMESKEVLKRLEVAKQVTYIQPNFHQENRWQGYPLGECFMFLVKIDADRGFWEISPYILQIFL